MEKTFHRRAASILEINFRKRALLGVDIFAPGPWDILLLAFVNGGKLQVHSLLETIGGSGSVLRRWLDILALRGLVDECVGDDGARHVALSDAGSAAILAALDVSGADIAPG